MPKRSAGLLPYRFRQGHLEVLLVHPGGPLWAKKDAGAWSIPKGEVGTEDDRVAAAREHLEELGSRPSEVGWIELGEVVQSGGKRVRAWAVPSDIDSSSITSNHFEMEWPPHSGRVQSFPEVDRAGWFQPDEARTKLISSQTAFLDRLTEAIGAVSHAEQHHSRD